MGCIAFPASPLTSECQNSGGISLLKLNGTDIQVYPDRSSVEDKYTFDPATGVGYITVSINVEFDYTAANVPVLTGLARNASLTSIIWQSVTKNESGNLSTYGHWSSTPSTPTSPDPRTFGGGSAFLTEGSFLSGQKLEDGSKVTMKIEIKSSGCIEYKTTDSSNEPTEEAIPESE